MMILEVLVQHQIQLEEKLSASEPREEVLHFVKSMNVCLLRSWFFLLLLH